MRRIVLPLVLVTFALVSAACASPPATPAATTSTPFDQQFIDMMVPHHQGALEMARLAEQRAQRPEIKQVASDVLRTQQVEIDQLQQWRQAWFDSDQTPPLSAMPMLEGMQMPATGGHGGHGGAASPAQTMDMAADVARLQVAPEPFDRAFLDAMIPHHQDAVAAAKAAETRAQRPEIKDLARAIIRDQEREIAQMQQWRQQWFPS